MAREGVGKVIPVLQMIVVVMVGIEPAQIGQLATFLQRTSVDSGLFGIADLLAEIFTDQVGIETEVVESSDLVGRDSNLEGISGFLSVVSTETSLEVSGFLTSRGSDGVDVVAVVVDWKGIGGETRGGSHQGCEERKSSDELHDYDRCDKTAAEGGVTAARCRTKCAFMKSPQVRSY